MTPFSINIRGRLIEVNRPLVMAIVNATTDSFFEGSRTGDDSEVTARYVEQMLGQGADIIDIGAYSTRPGSVAVTVEDETDRLVKAIAIARKAAGKDALISADTFRASVAEKAVEAGADIINDVSGGRFDADMFATVARLKVPYVLSHMPAATIADMHAPHSLEFGKGGVATHVVSSLSESIAQLRQLGVADIIIDPGFGFGKTVGENYELVAKLGDILELLRLPALVGVSRKSMLTKPLGITAGQALCATTALNLALLQQGAAILRVHDPLEAHQAIEIYKLMNKTA